MTTPATPDTSVRGTVGLSRTAAGRVVPRRDARRGVGPARGPGRAGRPASASPCSRSSRLWHLRTPREFEFDETYYAKDAWSLLHFGYVREYVGKANERILDGTVTALEGLPSMIVHPEVGKWLIALGEQAFGMDPFGWRFSAPQAAC